jgi:hypothetical protein
LTLQPPSAAYDDIEASTAYAARFPVVAPLRARVREERAEAKYWERDYDALKQSRDAGGTLTEQDSRILLMAANAAYRQLKINPADRGAAERLNQVVNQYGEIVKRDPTSIDAVYNYEFAARTRDLLVKGRGGRPGAPALREPGGGPSQTVHGIEGQPPVNPDMGEFKIIVPQRPDERQQRPEAGAGGAKIRKG